MGVVTVTFRRCLANSPLLGSQDGCASSRVLFDLDIDGKNYQEVYVDVREAGESETHDSALEISELHGYEGPLNYEVLRGSIEFFYRHVFGGKESRTDTKDKILTLRNEEINQEMVVQFEMPEEEVN